MIPGEHKRSILEQLRVANITAASLFPGADGLGLGLKELLTMRMAKIEELNASLVKTAEVFKTSFSVAVSAVVDDVQKSLKTRPQPSPAQTDDGLPA